jgi:Cys-rich protein (TIGR01571 family)
MTQISSNEFTEGLCGCFSDCSVCVITCLCPWYQVSKNKAMVDNRDCTVCDCCCAMPNLEYFTRQQIRARWSVPVCFLSPFLNYILVF